MSAVDAVRPRIGVREACEALGLPRPVASSGDRDAEAPK